MLLATVGGIVGAIAGLWTVRLVRFAFPNGVPFCLTFDPDVRVLVGAAIVILLTALVAGAMPAIQSTRLDVNRVLREGSRGGESLARSRGRTMLVVGELAMSTLLLVGGVVLLRSYRAYLDTDLGFDRADILTARITLPERSYDNLARRVSFFQSLEDRVRALPGVTVVGSAQGIPFSGWNTQAGLAFPDRSAAAPDDGIDAHYQAVFPDFFPRSASASCAGALSMNDRDTLAPVVVINETLARRVYPGKIRSGSGSSSARRASLARGTRSLASTARFPALRGAGADGTGGVPPVHGLQGRSQTLVIRTKSDDPYGLAPALRAAVSELDPQIALYDIKTMDDAVAQSFWRQRLQSQVLGVFAALAVVLAVIGMYGLISYGVAQRRREIGVRLALGARQSAVMGLVVRQGLALAATGVAIGMVASLLLVGVVKSLVYGVSASDPITYVLVGLVLFGVTVASTMIPARRAATVDPIEAMRAD